MKLNLLLAFLICAPALYSQTYKFNRQIIITFENEHKSHIDTWQIPITVEVQKKIIILRRPSNGIREKPYSDTLKIKDTGKERRDKHDIFTKYKMQDGRILLMYGDDYMTMCTKETKDHKRTEYVFYNQAKEDE